MINKRNKKRESNIDNLMVYEEGLHQKKEWR